MSSYGMVLSGGAARGAYEAGVMRYMFRELPRHLGYVPWPNVVSGTSVGALNGVFAVARDLDRLAQLCTAWRRMQIRDIYELRADSVFKALRSTFVPKDTAALLDPTALAQLVDAISPLRECRRVIDRGDCKAMIVSSTELSTGLNRLFVDSATPDLDLKPLPGARVERTQLTERHILASSALPFMFPPVEIGGRLLVDGGLRQNTPLRPVLQAGVTRALIISVHVDDEDQATRPIEDIHPTLPFLAGKSLNALMSDPVERDLREAQRINAILSWGRDRYGPEFGTAIERDLDIRPVRTLLLRPSEDLGQMAARMFKSQPPEADRGVRWLLSTLAEQSGDEGGESDLLSYVYFDRAFTAAAERLGFEDAARQETAIVSFLTGQV